LGEKFRDIPRLNRNILAQNLKFQKIEISKILRFLATNNSIAQSICFPPGKSSPPEIQVSPKASGLRPGKYYLFTPNCIFLAQIKYFDQKCAVGAVLVTFNFFECADLGGCTLTWAKNVLSFPANAGHNIITTSIDQIL
jgi:hypothetical protein